MGFALSAWLPDREMTGADETWKAEAVSVHVRCVWLSLGSESPLALCSRAASPAASGRALVSGRQSASCFDSGQVKPVRGRCPWDLKLGTDLTLQELLYPVAVLTTGCRKTIAFCRAFLELSFTWNGNKIERYHCFYWGRWKIILFQVSQNMMPHLASDCFKW